jgi:aspartokinase
MTPRIRLGGFKVLHEVVWISLTGRGEGGRGLAAELCRVLAREGVNLQFLTCAGGDGAWGVSMVAEPENARRALSLTSGRFEQLNPLSAKGAVLSLFPHRSDPEITAALLEVFGREGLAPQAIAYSNSAISAVLEEDCLECATDGLFEPFTFSAYRTPADWKLAQKGKEELYKEVVASYQEKKPKIYALEWQDRQELVQVETEGGRLDAVGRVFRELAQKDRVFTFLISVPSPHQGKTSIFFCIPGEDRATNPQAIRAMIPESRVNRVMPAAIFAMNGPHFGDRYGIAGELLGSFERRGIEIQALACSIHSVVGVVPAGQIQQGIDTIKQCFEVPSVIKKN